MRHWFVSFGLVLLFGAGVGALSWRLNMLGGLGDGPASQCEAVVGVPGPEDMQYDPRSKRTYITSFDRTAIIKGASAKGTSVRGAILGFDMQDPLLDANWRDRTGGVPEKFEPIGLSLYDAGGVRRLFVVNDADNSVLAYDIATNGDLTLVARYTDPRLTSPNDVVAFGPAQFYVTNDVAKGRNSLNGRVDFLLGIGSGELLMFDGNSWGSAARGLRFANGVTLSADGQKLIVAETAGKALSVFDRNRESGALSNRQHIGLDSFPDNLSWRDDGFLLIGSHPKPLALSTYMASPDKRRAPSQIFGLRFDGADQRPAKPVLLYQDDGRHLSAASVAVQQPGVTIIGSIMENKFLLCD